MVFLHKQGGASRKRNASFSSPLSHPPKAPKPTTTTTTATAAAAAAAAAAAPLPSHGTSEKSAIDKMVAVLAEAGCTLTNPAGPPLLPSDLLKFRHHLHHRFSADNDLRSDFIEGFSLYIESSKDLCRVLSPSNCDSFVTARNDSLVRCLLLIPSIQVDLQNLLLEKLPEYFNANLETSGSALSYKEDVARLIINHFRWLDFLVDSTAFVDKLMQILSICPLHLKKEIIGSLPEVIGDQNNKIVVDALEKMLQEDTSIIVPVLDSLSNLHLDCLLQEQVISLALSCIRTIDGEQMPFLLRFLLLSATPANVRKIISQIREQIKFIGGYNNRATQHKRLKGKSLVDGTEASILNTLRSGLRFKNILCQEILKELNSIQKPQDHKVVDIWLLILMHMNGESLQKSIEKIFKRKIIDDCIQVVMIDQCICGCAEFAQDYFSSFLSLAEYLLSCKEQKAREFGIHVYTCLFEEFVDMYSRQEVLGALVTHVGSGISFEVNSALETMSLLVTKHASDLIPLSAHINGILDYLEGFNIENLHKIYEVFSNLALSAKYSSDSYGSSFANELFMVVRKQVNHPDMNYKKMGLIGTMKIVSCLGDVNNDSSLDTSQNSNSEDTLQFLEMASDSCKQLALPSVLFNDELASMLEQRSLQPAIMEWIGKHVGEFESMFLSDLESGRLPVIDSYDGLEGELWMNLDGEISPICVNILPLASSSLQSSPLQILPAYFLLLSTIERLTNQGSLGGIDALLGCPLHLPASKYFSTAMWSVLTVRQKQIACLCVYYAINWIRELLNAFTTQLGTNQSNEKEITIKLLKRLRNLVFLESLLNDILESYPLSLPELHLNLAQHASSSLHKFYSLTSTNKENEQSKTRGRPSLTNRKGKKVADSLSSADGKLRQRTITEVFQKVATSQDVPNDGSASLPSKGRETELEDQPSSDSNVLITVEISASVKALEMQRHKFRPLQLCCHSILSSPKNKDSCCSDPMAELPLHLYLLRDLHSKLVYFSTSGAPPDKCFSSVPASCTTPKEFFSKIRMVFPTLRRHFDSAVSLLKEGDESCRGHWEALSIDSGNPDLPKFVLSKVSSSAFVIVELLNCFRNLFCLSYIQGDMSVLSELLGAFQLTTTSDSIIMSLQPQPLPGSIEYLYCGTFTFLENALEMACSFSFIMAYECLLTLESFISLAHKTLQNLGPNGKKFQLGFNNEALLNFRRRVGLSAEKLLKQKWDFEKAESCGKRKGEKIQKILYIYLENSTSTSNSLNELACSILPKVSWSRTAEADDNHDFATLCSATFLAYYRVLHEVNLTLFIDLVKEVMAYKHVAGQGKSEEILSKLLKSVNVVVSLVNMCRIHDKVPVHAMAIKYGGKFTDYFLKVFEFLEAHFQVHNGEIINLVKEIQKATRTLQTVCSEAKGMKLTAITSKVPATKRSLERFLFCVKGLLSNTSMGCTFWMGNLKHKDLAGQVVSSQAYLDEQNDSDSNDGEAPLGTSTEGQRESE